MKIKPTEKLQFKKSVFFFFSISLSHPALTRLAELEGGWQSMSAFLFITLIWVFVVVKNVYFIGYILLNQIKIRIITAPRCSADTETSQSGAEKAF